MGRLTSRADSQATQNLASDFRRRIQSVHLSPSALRSSASRVQSTRSSLPRRAFIAEASPRPTKPSAPRRLPSLSARAPSSSPPRTVTWWPICEANWTARWPMPLRPMTPTLLLRLSLARVRWLHAMAPAPMSGAACSEGSASGTGKAHRDRTRMRLARPPTWTGVSLITTAPLASPICRPTPTRCPGRTEVTRLPAATTSPMISRPGTAGSSVSSSARSCTSARPMPQAWISSSTSLGSSSGPYSNSASSRGPPRSLTA
mmetsp:Transcript_3388/g.11239  ORF Transcript_3388/g.11239 Transcript_3388/m.11239 type:complete len:260 (-) Transcript_3388:212-991(-)